jgi:hypothetical protein
MLNYTVDNRVQLEAESIFVLREVAAQSQNTDLVVASVQESIDGGRVQEACFALTARRQSRVACRGRSWLCTLLVSAATPRQDGLVVVDPGNYPACNP